MRKSSFGSQRLDYETSSPYALTERGWRENIQMARDFQSAPIIPEPPMTEACEVRGSNNELSRNWAKTLLALAQQLNRINDMLYDVTESNHIVAGSTRNVGNHTVENLQPSAPGVGCGPRIRINARHSPTKRSHPSDELAIPAAHIEQLSNVRSR